MQTRALVASSVLATGAAAPAVGPPFPQLNHDQSTPTQCCRCLWVPVLKVVHSACPTHAQALPHSPPSCILQPTRACLCVQLHTPQRKQTRCCRLCIWRMRALVGHAAVSPECRPTDTCSRAPANASHCSSSSSWAACSASRSGPDLQGGLRGQLLAHEQQTQAQAHQLGPRLCQLLRGPRHQRLHAPPLSSW